VFVLVSAALWPAHPRPRRAVQWRGFRCGLGILPTGVHQSCCGRRCGCPSGDLGGSASPV